MNGTDSEIRLARAQRDQAIACAILSLFIALALFFSNFGPEPQTEQARKAVLEHQALFAQLQRVLQDNQTELSQDQATLGSLRRAAHP
jgi:lipopolysaccharide export LptBFGC system permease protein LptF